MKEENILDVVGIFNEPPKTRCAGTRWDVSDTDLIFIPTGYKIPINELRNKPVDWMIHIGEKRGYIWTDKDVADFLWICGALIKRT